MDTVYRLEILKSQITISELHISDVSAFLLAKRDERAAKSEYYEKDKEEKREKAHIKHLTKWRESLHLKGGEKEYSEYSGE